MARRHFELHLVIYTESHAASGIALASQFASHSGFSTLITVTSDSSSLFEHTKAKLEATSWPTHVAVKLSQQTDQEFELVAHLKQQTGLRLVIVGGLDQLNDQAREILRGVPVMVVCYEAHTGLEHPPGHIWGLGKDHGGDLQWFAEHVIAYGRVDALDAEDPETEKRLTNEHEQSDWVLISATHDELDQALKRSKQAIQTAVGPVLLVCGEMSWWRTFLDLQVPSLATRFIPQMSRDERRELSSHLEKHSTLDFEFTALICSSTFLAAFGLLQNSAAVIIGAMLVAPLMTPILGAGLSLAHGNRPLFFRSIKTILLGFIAALASSCCFGLIVRLLVPSALSFDGPSVVMTSEMWARTHPSALDFLVGLVGGSAAAFARTRSHLADALAGAAIAAALVPPIALAGLQVAFLGMPLVPPNNPGPATNLIYGPTLLFVANMLTIMIGSSFVLWACGIRADHRHTRRERWSMRTMIVLITLTVIALVWIVQHP